MKKNCETEILILTLFQEPNVKLRKCRIILNKDDVYISNRLRAKLGIIN